MTDSRYALTVRPDGSDIQLSRLTPCSDIREGEMLVVGRDGAVRRKLLKDRSKGGVLVAMITPPMSERAVTDAIDYAAQLVDAKQNGQAKLLEPKVWARMVIDEMRAIVGSYAVRL